MTEAERSPSPRSLAAQILAMRCPRCAGASLFDGPVRFAARCGACGLDFGQFNVGDGPAAFLILIVGGIVTALALIVQLRFDPPFWVHILLWVPLATLAVIYCLRASKAALLILEYRNQAREGRVTPIGAASAPTGDRA